MDIISLTGTPKQIAWAESIRERYIALYKKAQEMEITDSPTYALDSTFGTIEHLVANAHENDFTNDSGHFSLNKMETQFMDEKYTRWYAKENKIEITDEFKRISEEKESESNKKYKIWLIEELEKVISTESSAKWWIENR